MKKDPLCHRPLLRSKTQECDVFESVSPITQMWFLYSKLYLARLFYSDCTNKTEALCSAWHHVDDVQNRLVWVCLADRTEDTLLSNNCRDSRKFKLCFVPLEEYMYYVNIHISRKSIQKIIIPFEWYTLKENCGKH